MFAVLKTGGKQYRVQTGDVLRVERIAAQAGETVQFNDVLMVGGDAPVVGAPLVEGAAVQAEVIDQIKADKVIHFVKRRRKHSSQRTKGHRQKLTLVRVTDILPSGADATGVKAAIGTGSVSGFAIEAAAPKAAKPAKAEATSGAAPANLLSEARDGAGDDLKKLTGVGPKMVEKLNEAGVFHFDQIAAWTAEDVAYMEEQLGARGKVDGWVAEAADMAQDKE
ncbi:50S ribosomal protein L21 [Rhodobacteraceae bacterium 2376]|uniref:Large ribosomal subunit protein bL21 n=1 Tax=Rhabdonatronobacter sediminivivens TaxID=2743469 RepID=A0A7Z0HXX4_9RHOB|nr:50S ribosomal protein L21 [Rhabdonatronobacter sediminivivens]NYS24346.1 50S ribosomal protein L21 [Rhabdonatronobacter sediminivivens]